MSGKIRLAYCLVHARRNFVKVHKTTNSPFAREVIERIGAVYAIEEGIRGLAADERRAARQAETKPLMAALKARLEAVKDGGGGSGRRALQRRHFRVPLARPCNPPPREDP
jgi:hypothetical protein